MKSKTFGKCRRYSAFRHLDSVFVKRKPIQLTLFLTRRCNAKCDFCFYLSQKKRKIDAGELTIAEIKRIAAGFGDLLWLAFSGGEIFLRPDLPEIAEIFYNRNRPAIILLPTNGLLPEVIRAHTEAILNKCPKSTVVVKVSLDGDPRTHDALRGVPNAHAQALGTYARLEELLDCYDNFELGINTVFCAATQDGIVDHIETVREFESCKTHTVSLIRGEVDNTGHKEVCLEKYERAGGVLTENLRRSTAGRYRFNGGRLKAAQDILQRRLIGRTAEENRQIIPCYAGRLTLVITETGDVYPCESFAGKIANLREIDFDFKRLFESEEYRGVVKGIRDGRCHCHHECYMMMNILFNPRRYPALFRQYLAL